MHVNDKLDEGIESADNVLWKSAVRSRAYFTIPMDDTRFSLRLGHILLYKSGAAKG